MKQLNDTTDFQRKCMQRTKSLARKIIGKPIVFKKITGRKEIFYRCQVKNIDIYVYSDEAGFMLSNKKWTICERPDYSSPEELMMDFLSQLREEILAPASQRLTQT